jgi:hypothetical protein
MTVRIRKEEKGGQIKGEKDTTKTQAKKLSSPKKKKTINSFSLNFF